MIDTNALIRYTGIQLKNDNAVISKPAKEILDNGFIGSSYVLFMCSISIIEIWSNLRRLDEDLESFKTTIKLLYENPNIRIIDLSIDTLDYYTRLQNIGELKEHDRVIYAASQEFNCDIILSSDNSIKEYSKLTKGPEVISS